MSIKFLNPHWLWLLLIIPLMIVYKVLIKKQHMPTFRLPTATILQPFAKPSHLWPICIPILLQCLIIAGVIIALARPVLPEQFKKIKGKGIDIILAMDVSTSMRAIDFQPNNRLFVAKEEARNFIEQRPGDRIGLVIFGGTSYTQCPLTADHNMLFTFLQEIRTGMIKDGTAVGMGISTSLNRLRTSKAKSKVVILLTDGRNNTGDIDPLTAAQLAADMNIKIYPIAVGKEGISQIPIDHPLYGRQYVSQQLDIDMETLNAIAEITGTKQALRAQNAAQLKAVLHEIDRMERSDVSEKVHYRYTDLFYYLLYFVLVCMFIKECLSITILKRIP